MNPQPIIRVLGKHFTISSATDQTETLAARVRSMGGGGCSRAPDRLGLGETAGRQEMSSNLQRYRGVLVTAGLLALALAIYLPYALKGGWYYDDWALYSAFQDTGSSWTAQFEACTEQITGGRKLTCAYHTSVYHFLTDSHTAYHLVAIGFLVAMATLLYAVLRRCRLGWIWSALAAALLIVFPASDSTRLWPTGAIGQFVIVLVLVGVLLALSALGRKAGWRQYALHAGAALLFVFAMTTYEIAVPLVALSTSASPSSSSFTG
jgi:hypothetical protein